MPAQKNPKAISPLINLLQKDHILFCMINIGWRLACNQNKLTTASVKNRAANPMFNPTLIVIEAFIHELRAMYERTYGILEPEYPATLPTTTSITPSWSHLLARKFFGAGISASVV
jgi:hypothetical protein